MALILFARMPITAQCYIENGSRKGKRPSNDLSPPDTRNQKCAGILTAMISQKEKYTSVLKDLCSIIENKSQKLDNRKITVAIAGAGCLGKTTLSRRLRSMIGPSECQIVSLDAYLLERKTRLKLGQLTGYDPHGFELSRASRELEILIRHQKSIVLYQYNRLTHLRDVREIVRPRRVLIVEGCLALSKPIICFSDLRIFLESGRTTQYALRLKREQMAFGSGEAEFQSRFIRYYSDYLIYIKPQISVADLILLVSQDYGLTTIRHRVSPGCREVEKPETGNIHDHASRAFQQKVNERLA